MLPDNLTSPLNDFANPKTGQYVCFIDSDWQEIVNQMEKLTVPHEVRHCYSLNGRHCWVVYITGVIREKKKTRSK